MADAVVIFDGQSLPGWPTVTSPFNFPNLILADRPRLVGGIPGVAGLSWTQLDNDAVTYREGVPVAGRWHRYLRLSDVLVYDMTGGTTQIGLGSTAAALYASEGAIAQQFKDVCTVLGVTGYVLGSTTTPSSTFDAGEEAVRVAANALKLTDAAGYYDDCVDLTADACLEDPLGACYSDGTHPSLLGRQTIAAYKGPAIDALL